MARNVANVWVGADGRAYVAPTGTSAPANASASWSGAWAELGWTSEDGLTEGQNEQYSEIKGWDGTVLRKVLTSTEKTFQLTFQEINKHVLELYHSNSTVEWISGGSQLDVATPSNDLRAFGFDIADGDRVVRVVIPSGEVTARGDITYKNDQAIQAQVTITAYPDENGVTATFLFTEDYSS